MSDLMALPGTHLYSICPIVLFSISSGSPPDLFSIGQSERSQSSLRVLKDTNLWPQYGQDRACPRSAFLQSSATSRHRPTMIRLLVVPVPMRKLATISRCFVLARNHVFIEFKLLRITSVSFQSCGQDAMLNMYLYSPSSAICENVCWMLHLRSLLWLLEFLTICTFCSRFSLLFKNSHWQG